MLANQRKAVEMSARRAGLEVPEWPEVTEERLKEERRKQQELANSIVNEAAAQIQS